MFVNNQYTPCINVLRGEVADITWLREIKFSINKPKQIKEILGES